MCTEIKIQKDYLQNERIETVYFGGGTPSILSAGEIQKLLEAINHSHRLSTDLEITLECNPDDISVRKLEDFTAAGINRLSLGVQSFNDAMLTYLNRAHLGKQAMRSIRQIEESRIDNYSIDLIYALPSENHDLFYQDLQIMLDIKPPHLSTYCLTIEEKTVFGNWLKSNKIQAVDDDFAADQYEYLMDRLTRAGYLHYEISNFALPGFESRHNLGYWEHLMFSGIGPGAHSFNGVNRQFNIRNNAQYISSIKKGSVPYELIHMTGLDLVNEYILTGLRTARGISLEFLKKHYQYDLINSGNSSLRSFLDAGLVLIQEEHLALSRKGKFLADKIASDLFITTE